MPSRSFSASSYRYGFNRQEKDNEISGSGNHIDFKYRGYDPRLGKFWSIDPMFKEFPYYSSYQFASNNPILAIDLEGLETSNNKNKTEKKTTTKEKAVDNNKPAEEKKVLDTKTVGKNFDGSNYISLHNPKNTDGTDSYEPKPQESMDGRAMRHDKGSGFVQARNNENLKEDGVFIVGALSDLAKSVENTFVLPYSGIGDAKPNLNKDPYTNKPISGTTAKRAAVGAVGITVVTAMKIILRVTVDPAVKVYDYIGDFINDVKYETSKGIESVNNWAPH